MTKVVNNHRYPATMAKYLEKRPSSNDVKPHSRKKNLKKPQSDMIQTELEQTRIEMSWQNGTLVFEDQGSFIPGRGVRTTNRCGNVLGFYKCPTCGEVDNWKYQCSKAVCPDCFGSWILRRSRESGNRLEQIALMLGKSPRHIILSPPPDWDGSRKSLYRVLGVLGVRGGLFIEHPWRFREKATDAYLAWKLCDINPSSEAKVPSYAVRSFHIHMLVFGFLLQADHFYDQTGWVYKNKGTRDAVRYQAKKARKDGPIYRTLKYILSHTGIKGRKQTVTWFGICANNKVNVDIVPDYLAKLCPLCDSEMDKFQLLEGEPVRVENKQKVRFKFYRFKEW